jgi:hypothetical protein
MVAEQALEEILLSVLNLLPPWNILQVARNTACTLPSSDDIWLQKGLSIFHPLCFSQPPHSPWNLEMSFTFSLRGYLSQEYICFIL